MPEELTYKDEAAAEYDRAFAHVTRYFTPFVLRAARVARGMRVLDIAAGTGLSAEAALSAVGPTGHVTAADVSPAMAEKARERLGEARNASVLVEDAQALSFSVETLDGARWNVRFGPISDMSMLLSSRRDYSWPKVAHPGNSGLQSNRGYPLGSVVIWRTRDLRWSVCRHRAAFRASGRAQQCAH
jgi:SAM-dependent methyltransferase